jgi:hypothetical protein
LTAIVDHKRSGCRQMVLIIHLVTDRAYMPHTALGHAELKPACAIRAKFQLFAYHRSFCLICCISLIGYISLIGCISLIGFIGLMCSINRQANW